MVDTRMLREQRRINFIRSLLLLAGLLGLALLLGWVLAGVTGMIWAAAAAAATLALGSLAPAGTFLRLQGARPLPEHMAPTLYAMLRDLAARVGLESAPTLQILPANPLAAATVGSGKETVIALGSGLMRLLSQREMAAVLAHELSHVRHKDLKLMGLAAVAGQVTQFISLMGQVLVLINLPLWLAGGHPLPWLPLIALMLAPWAASLMLMALSRTREYEADADAAALTGDPPALASALDKMERASRPFMSRFFRPGGGNAGDPLLATHPPTRERVARLLRMAGQDPAATPPRPRFQPPPGFGRFRSSDRPF